jgi:hypothetical protein
MKKVRIMNATYRVIAHCTLLDDYNDFQCRPHREQSHRYEILGVHDRGAQASKYPQLFCSATGTRCSLLTIHEY